jgi:BirA family transcriptional regulator, biotin operon repressor / biotin---[acetyl-CoA-carboxylase] ligase
VVERAAISPRPWPPGWTVEHVAETGSTNADLLATAASRPDRSALVAGHQTAGRGRLDRRWDAPPGTNLLVSLLFHDVAGDPSELTRRVGLAAVDACREAAGITAVLKWPNDVLVGDRKLAGILAERSSIGSVVVGLGLNVRWAPPGAARLGPDVDPLDVLSALLATFDRLPADVTARYRQTLATLGRRVRIELVDGVIDGTATDVDPDGRLVVLDNCAVTHRIAVGDVVHVR